MYKLFWAVVTRSSLPSLITRRNRLSGLNDSAPRLPLPAVGLFSSRSHLGKLWRDQGRQPAFITPARTSQSTWRAARSQGDWCFSHLPDAFICPNRVQPSLLRRAPGGSSPSPVSPHCRRSQRRKRLYPGFPGDDQHQKCLCFFFPFFSFLSFFHQVLEFPLIFSFSHAGLTHERHRDVISAWKA